MSDTEVKIAHGGHAWRGYELLVWMPTNSRFSRRRLADQRNDREVGVEGQAANVATGVRKVSRATATAVIRWLRREHVIVAAHGARCGGYDLLRWLKEPGAACVEFAPSSIVRAPGGLASADRREER